MLISIIRLCLKRTYLVHKYQSSVTTESVSMFYNFDYLLNIIHQYFYSSSFHSTLLTRVRLN